MRTDACGNLSRLAAAAETFLASLTERISIAFPPRQSEQDIFVAKFPPNYEANLIVAHEELQLAIDDANVFLEKVRRGGDR